MLTILKLLSSWVNKGSEVSCLELAEALANETPVRLDLLLSLAPPPIHGSDKLVVTDEVRIILFDFIFNIYILEIK